MTGDEKTAVQPEEIEVGFARTEAAIEDAMHHLLALGRKTDRYAEENGITPFKSAAHRQSFGNAAKSLGDALAEVVAMHKESAALDPRPKPRSGDGK